MIFVYIVVSLLVVCFLCLQLQSYFDRRNARTTWQLLQAKAVAAPDAFHPSMLEGLPEAAKRYFLFTIATGALLRTVAEVRLSGDISLGTKDNPSYMPLQAHQLLAPPYGLVWNCSAGAGVMTMVGSDSSINDKAWTRFWWWQTVPMLRLGGTSNYARSSLGRVMAEAVAWAPAALLPQYGVLWEEVSKNKAKATLMHHGWSQTLELTVADDGMPLSILIERWSNANPEREWQLQSFGGVLSEFKEFGGFKLATYIEGGNHFETDNYFPFYKARLEQIVFH